MWFKKDRAPKEPREGRQSKVPEGLWVKCDNCRQILYNKELARNFKICPKCGFHFRLSAPERLRMLFDGEEYVEHDTNLRSSDPLKFRDSKKYRDRLRDAEDSVGPSDAIVVASGTLEGIPVVIGGVIPKKDIPALKAIGVKEVYPIGSTFVEIAQGIQKIVNK